MGELSSRHLCKKMFQHSRPPHMGNAVEMGEAQTFQQKQTLDCR